MLASEKVYQDFTLSTQNQGGHSARPTPDNAIYQLVHALAKVEAHQFKVEFNDTSRAYFEKFGVIEGGQKGADMIAAAKSGDAAAIERLKKDPSSNSILRTNCVATQLAGGHAPNALPQRATANVNCRMFPGRSAEEIRQELIAAIADPGVSVEFQAIRRKSPARAAACRVKSWRRSRL